MSLYCPARAARKSDYVTLEQRVLTCKCQTAAKGNVRVFFYCRHNNSLSVLR